ncbi:MAG: tRNA (adenosine(37)-N6)-dimethylallyltransferase MiaA, partial [Actinobacteria bacterium]|nr:tRNA (adenosine(37)-N6)-dimethylallyltransferase MiaA [Actinomycetota bacterium]
SSPDEAAEALADRIVAATNRFARRQESWFRSDPRIEWFDASGPDLANRLVDFFQAPARG